MKKNKYFAYLLFLLPALLAVVACNPEQDEYFDVPSSKRVNNLLNSTRQALMKSEHGWVFEVYPGLRDKDQENGGFVYTVKFDSLQATIRGEMSGDPAISETSYYKMTSEGGPGIIFDTGNKLFHILAEGTSDRYQAYGGDIEYLIDSVGVDVIKLHGARSGNTCYLRRLTMPAEEYVKGVIAVQSDFIFGTYGGSIGGKKVGVGFDLNNNQFYVNPDTTNKASEEMEVAFVYTNKGIHFYQPITVNGVELSELAFDYEAGTLTSTGEGGKAFTLQGVLPEGFRKFSEYEGTYQLVYGGTKKLTVKLTPDKEKGCFYMTNFFANSPETPVVLNYNKATGTLFWNSQPIGEEGGNIVFMCAWALDADGTLTWNTEAGMKTSWNGDEAHPVYTWVNNGMTNYVIDSFIMWTLKPTGGSAGKYKGSKYLVGTTRLSHQIAHVTKMIKQ